MQSLFSQANLYDIFDQPNAEMKKVVEALPRDEILGVSDEDLVAHLVSACSVLVSV